METKLFLSDLYQKFLNDLEKKSYHNIFIKGEIGIGKTEVVLKSIEKISQSKNLSFEYISIPHVKFSTMKIIKDNKTEIICGFPQDKDILILDDFNYMLNFLVGYEVISLAERRQIGNIKFDKLKLLIVIANTERQLLKHFEKEFLKHFEKITVVINSYETINYLSRKYKIHPITIQQLLEGGFSPREIENHLKIQYILGEDKIIKWPFTKFSYKDKKELNYDMTKYDHCIN